MDALAYASGLCRLLPTVPNLCVGRPPGPAAPPSGTGPRVPLPSARALSPERLLTAGGLQNPEPRNLGQ